MVGTVRTYLQRMTVRAVRAVSSTVYPYIVQEDSNFEIFMGWMVASTI